MAEQSRDDTILALIKKANREKKIPSTDGDILALARRINAYQLKILELMDEIQDSSHPYASQIYQSIEANIFAYASAVHCVWHHFSHPERWEQDGIDIKRRP